MAKGGVRYPDSSEMKYFPLQDAKSLSISLYKRERIADSFTV